MDIVTLLNIFNCYSSIFPMFPNNEKRKKTVSWLHVKFGIKTLIWRKLTKTSPTEDFLDTVIQFWTFSQQDRKCFVYMQFYTILLERLKQLQTRDRVIVTCYLNFRAHVSWVTLLVCSFVTL